MPWYKCSDEEGRNYCTNAFSNQGITVLFVFEFMQRFSFYGVYATMFLFFRHELEMSVPVATGFVHTFGFIFYLCPTIGAMLADTKLGQFFAVVTYSVIQLVGAFLVAIASSAEGIGFTRENKKSFMVATSLIGFLLHVVGAGMLRATLTSFTRDQFLNDAEDNEVTCRYFVAVFNAMSLSMLLGVLFAPTMRMSMECTGLPYCFPAGYAMCIAALIIGLVVLGVGYVSYNVVNPTRSIVVDTIDCVKSAWSNRKQRKAGDHRLDVASDEFGPAFVQDVKQSLHALWLFVTLPIFWALFEQMWSRWIYQGTALDGEYGSNWATEPDSMPALNALLVIFILPLCEMICVPLCDRFNITAATRIRIIIGAIMAILAFAVAALIQTKIDARENTNPDLTSGRAELYFWSSTGSACNMTVKTDIKDHETFYLLGEHLTHFNVEIDKVMDFEIKNYYCSVTMADKVVRNFTWLTLNPEENAKKKILLHAYEGVPNHYFIESRHPDVKMPGTEGQGSPGVPYPTQFFSNNKPLGNIHFTDFIKSELQLAKVGIMYYFYPEIDSPIKSNKVTIYNQWHGTGKVYVLDYNHHAIDFEWWQPRTYGLNLNSDKGTVQLRRGGIYILWLKQQGIRNPALTMAEIVPPNTEPIWWQFFQYFFLTLAQLMFPVTVLEYANTQVHVRMQGFILLCWYATIALGNLIVVILSMAQIFHKEIEYMFLYMALMVIDLILLIVTMIFYADQSEDVDEYIPESRRSTRRSTGRRSTGRRSTVNAPLLSRWWGGGR